MAGREDALMEKLVGTVVIGAAVHGALQRMVGQADRLHLIGRGPLAGPAHGHRLDGATQVQQVIDKIFRQTAA
ncbi:hypothetical protein D3C84_1053780 [compost metagenome]